MKLHVINTGNFKLDGGAMFGVVPKSLWSRTNEPDSNNLCTWAMRSLLIEQDNRLILIDTGIGNKQNEKFFSHFHLHGDDSLKKSINNAGFSIDDITDVFLTHLHFDHCGGGTTRDKSGSFCRPLFKRAKYWSNKNHWLWAKAPNARERASFLNENLSPIESSGALSYVSQHSKGFEYKKELGFDVLFVDGHTEKQMIPKISYQNKSLVFAADLIPTLGHVPVPYIMGYDIRPLVSMSEKDLFLKEAV